MTFSSSFFFHRTIAERTLFIFSIVSLFWFLFFLVFLLNRLIIFFRTRWTSKKKNVCEVYVISSPSSFSNQYGSFPSSIPMELQITSHRLDDYLSTLNPQMINSKRKIDDSQTMAICYSFSCINKQTSINSGRYRRLSSSTSLTRPVILPIVMITDCSNSQRLHTDILQFNDE